MIDRSLARRATAEFVGTAMLVAIVIGSGIYAQRLSPNDVGIQLLEHFDRRLWAYELFEYSA